MQLSTGTGYIKSERVKKLGGVDGLKCVADGAVEGLKCAAVEGIEGLKYVAGDGVEGLKGVSFKVPSCFHMR